MHTCFCWCDHLRFGHPKRTIQNIQNSVTLNYVYFQIIFCQSQYLTKGNKQLTPHLSILPTTIDFNLNIQLVSSSKVNLHWVWFGTIKKKGKNVNVIILSVWLWLYSLKYAMIFTIYLFKYIYMSGYSPFRRRKKFLRHGTACPTRSYMNFINIPLPL